VFSKPVTFFNCPLFSASKAARTLLGLWLNKPIFMAEQRSKWL
jgi:hypothetical protein